MVLTFLVNLGEAHAKRVEVVAWIASIPDVGRFVAQIGNAAGWDSGAVQRLERACEEAMLFLIENSDQHSSNRERAVRPSVNASEQNINLEFLCGRAGANLVNAAQKIDHNAPPSA